MTIEEARIQVFDYHKEKLQRNTSAQILQWRLLLKYKYQIAMETAEPNTSKQISAKETALQNVYKYSLLLLLYIFETESKKWNKGIFRVIMVLV